jgi:dTDP-glucose pyrophosphorylase
MIILIPMAGEGRRFIQEGYSLHKPVIPTTDWRTGEKVPMVVAATKDLPGLNDPQTGVIYVDRDFHKRDGVHEMIQSEIPCASFITLDHLTEGQACTCLHARDDIYSDDELLIAGCDNGMVFDLAKFNAMKSKADMLVFTYRHHELILENPDAYGWVKVENDGINAIDVSVKKAISNFPMNDHAIVSTFWFKHGCDFVEASDTMIQKNDRINGEFYVDQVIKYALKMDLRVHVFEIQKYLGWGTPIDYENYEKTWAYWSEFVDQEEIV